MPRSGGLFDSGCDHVENYRSGAIAVAAPLFKRINLLVDATVIDGVISPLRQ